MFHLIFFSLRFNHIKTPILLFFKKRKKVIAFETLPGSKELMWPPSSGVSYPNIHITYGLPWLQSGKESACQCRREGIDP